MHKLKKKKKTQLCQQIIAFMDNVRSGWDTAWGHDCIFLLYVL
jgi:hypothetical protein